MLFLKQPSSFSSWLGRSSAARNSLNETTQRYAALERWQQSTFTACATTKTTKTTKKQQYGRQTYDSVSESMVIKLLLDPLLWWCWVKLLELSLASLPRSAILLPLAASASASSFALQSSSCFRRRRFDTRPFAFGTSFLMAPD